MLMSVLPCTGVGSNLYEDELKESSHRHNIYGLYCRMSIQELYVMSVLQYDMLDVNPSQKFYVNMGPVLTGYGPMDVSCHTFCVCACVFYIVFKDVNE